MLLVQGPGTRLPKLPLRVGHLGNCARSNYYYNAQVLHHILSSLTVDHYHEPLFFILKPALDQPPALLRFSNSKTPKLGSSRA